MLKERTPFTGRSVVYWRAATKLPSTVTMAGEPGGAKRSDHFASVPYETGERVRFDMDKLLTMPAING